MPNQLTPYCECCGAYFNIRDWEHFYAMRRVCFMCYGHEGMFGEDRSSYNDEEAVVSTCGWDPNNRQRTRPRRDFLADPVEGTEFFGPTIATIPLWRRRVLSGQQFETIKENEPC